MGAFSGMRLPPKHIRNCLDALFSPEYRANRSAVAHIMRGREWSCQLIDIRLLVMGRYQDTFRGRPRKESELTKACFCHGHLCNARDSAASKLLRLNFTFVLLLNVVAMKFLSMFFNVDVL